MVVLFVNSEIWVQDRMNMSVAMILELMLTQGEIYIYDMAKHRIHKYDIFSASYKESIIIDKSIDIDYIMCNSGCLYAAQASNRNEEKESIYYLLYQIDVKSGKKNSSMV